MFNAINGYFISFAQTAEIFFAWFARTILPQIQSAFTWLWTNIRALTSVIGKFVWRQAKKLSVFIVYTVIPWAAKAAYVLLKEIVKFLLPYVKILLTFILDLMTGKHGLTAAVFINGAILFTAGFSFNSQMMAVTGVLLVIAGTMLFLKNLTGR